jgi:outer membrane immunogenic protein
MGRVGIAYTNNLFYVKGGCAGVNNRLSVTDALPPVLGSGSQTQWHNSWTVGAGWEYGVIQNWIVGLE